MALFLFVGSLTEGVPGSRDAVEMRLQRAIGFIGIVAADRVNDRNMLLIANVVMLVQSLISHGWACGDQPVEQGNVDRHEDWVTGDLRQHAVEINV